MRWLPLALLGANFFASVDVSGATLSIGEFVDTEACYSAIEESVVDKDGDQRMDPESYVGFVKAYGPDDFLEDISRFEELPLILINNFYLLACMCGTKPDDECCVGSKAGIETDGALSGVTPTDHEMSYLFLVCAQTNTAIERVIDSLSPSAAPAPDPADDSSSEIQVNYTIGVENEISVFEDYEEELISAMDSMAPTLLSEVRKRQLRVGRNLQSIFLPTSITYHTMIGKLNAFKFSCTFHICRRRVRLSHMLVMWFSQLYFLALFSLFVATRRVSSESDKACFAL